jgi:hypothetical protein
MFELGLPYRACYPTLGVGTVEVSFCKLSNAVVAQPRFIPAIWGNTQKPVVI